MFKKLLLLLLASVGNGVLHAASGAPGKLSNNSIFANFKPPVGMPGQAPAKSTSLATPSTSQEAETPEDLAVARSFAATQDLREQKARTAQERIRARSKNIRNKRFVVKTTDDIPTAASKNPAIHPASQSLTIGSRADLEALLSATLAPEEQTPAQPELNNDASSSSGATDVKETDTPSSLLQYYITVRTPRTSAPRQATSDHEENDSDDDTPNLGALFKQVKTQSTNTAEPSLISLTATEVSEARSSTPTTLQTPATSSSELTPVSSQLSSSHARVSSPSTSSTAPQRPLRKRRQQKGTSATVTQKKNSVDLFAQALIKEPSNMPTTEAYRRPSSRRSNPTRGGQQHANTLGSTTPQPVVTQPTTTNEFDSPEFLANLAQSLVPVFDEIQNDINTPEAPEHSSEPASSYAAAVDANQRTQEEQEKLNTELHDVIYKMQVHRQDAEEVARLLNQARSYIDQGADVNAKNSSGTPVILAAVVYPLNDDISAELVAYILQPHRGCTTIDATSEMVGFHQANISTPLTRAAANNQIKTLKVLLEHGANPNTPNKLGRAALHFAASRDNTEMIQILLAAGADPLLQNRDGETALELTKCDTCKQLLEAAVGQERQSTADQTPSMSSFSTSSSDLPPISPERSNSSSQVPSIHAAQDDASIFTTVTRATLTPASNIFDTPEHSLTPSEDLALFGNGTQTNQVSDNLDSLLMAIDELATKEQASTPNAIENAQHEEEFVDADIAGIVPPVAPDQQGELNDLAATDPGAAPSGYTATREPTSPQTPDEIHPLVEEDTLESDDQSSTEDTADTTPPTDAQPAQTSINKTKWAGRALMLASTLGIGQLTYPEFKKAHHAVIDAAQKAGVILTWPAYLKAMGRYFKQDIMNKENRKKYALVGATTLAFFAGLGIEFASH